MANLDWSQATLAKDDEDLEPVPATEPKGFIPKGRYTPPQQGGSLDWSQASRDKTFDQGFSGTLKSGITQATRAISATGNLYAGDTDRISELADAQKAERKDARLEGFYNDVVKNTGMGTGGEAGLWESVKGVGRAAVDNPAGAALAVTEQIPNAAPTLAGGVAGAKAGSKIGGVAGAKGKAAGAALGYVTGMWFGNTATETGHKALDAVANEGALSEEDATRIKKEGAIKGGVISIVDGLTLGVGGKISSAFRQTASNAVESATRKALTRAGVDVTDAAAVAAARTNPVISSAVMDAQKNAARLTDSLRRRSAEIGIGLTIESIGEGLGEYLGEAAATGQQSVPEAVLEGLLSLGQSGAETAFNVVRARRTPVISDEWRAAPVITPTITDEDDQEIVVQPSVAAGLDPAKGVMNAAAAVAVDSGAATGSAVAPAGSVLNPAAEGGAEATGAGVTAQRDAGQSSVLEGVVASPPATASGFTTVDTVSGKPVTVRTEDLQSDAPLLRQYTEAGKAKAVPAIRRDSIIAPAEDVLTPQAGATIVQPRDRSRPASVVQMQSMAANPDYMRLGASRSPESGAPMVFAVGDRHDNVKALGRKDVAVMSDGQRVPFQYAVVEAEDAQPSNFADGRVNPLFDSGGTGTVVALNNGRVAGLRAAYDRNTAGGYRQEMESDAPMHGIDPAVIGSMRHPVLVRLYSEKDNRANMGARSQSQALGMSATEQAQADAEMMDAGVIEAFGAGEMDRASNREFVRAFIGRLQANGQDVAGMVDAGGALSPDGARRLQAALVHKAFGDGGLVEQMFGSTDNDIRAIGEALKAVAGEWASMRHAAASRIVNQQVDVTGNLLQAIRMVQKARRENSSLYDAVRQRDLVTGEEVDAITVGVLHLLYSGEHLTRAVGRTRLEQSLRDYVASAMTTRNMPDMLGEQVGPAQILAAMTGERVTQRGQDNGTESTDISAEGSKAAEVQRGTTGDSIVGIGADEAGARAQRQEPDGASPEDGRVDQSGVVAGGTADTAASSGESEVDLFGVAPSASQQAAAKARADKEADEQRRRDASPPPEMFRLGMEDARTGREVDPGQQEMLDGNDAAAPTVAKNVEPAMDAADVIERHGLPADTQFNQGKGALGSGKWIAISGKRQGNLEETIDKAAQSLAKFIEIDKANISSQERKDSLAREVAAKIKNGDQPSDVDLRDLFGLEPRHTYVDQAAVGWFLVNYMGVSRNGIRKALGLAAGDRTSDGGAKYPIVFPRKLHKVFGPKQNADSPIAAKNAGQPQDGEIQSLRQQLRDVEAKIIQAAPDAMGQGGGNIEAAMKSRNVPVSLKRQRRMLKEQLRALTIEKTSRVGDGGDVRVSRENTSTDAIENHLSVQEVENASSEGGEYANTQESLASRLAQWSSVIRLGDGGPRPVETNAESIGTVTRNESGAAYQGDVDRGEIREQSQRLIRQAKARGFFWEHDSPILAALDALPSDRISGGAEHRVFIVGDGAERFVIRATDNGFFGPRSDISPAQYMARLDDYSQTFPAMQTQVIGVSESGEVEGNAVIWTAQPYVRGSTFDSQTSLADAMRTRGWEQVGGAQSVRFRHPSTGTIIEDANTDNVFQGDNGDLYPFDVVVEALPANDLRLTADTQSSEIKMSKAAKRSAERNLIITHNLSPEKLLHAVKMGGLAHEIGIHMAADTTSERGRKAMDKLVNRAGMILRSDNSGFMEGVRQRMQDAGETSNEEAAAYIAEEYVRARVNAPASVKRWVQDFIAAARAWLFGKGVVIKADQLTPADIAAVARANVRKAAQAPAFRQDDEGTTRRSVASLADTEVRALVEQYANEDGAPSEGQIREAVRQFRETERAYGGRETWRKASDANRTKLTYGQWVQVRTENFKNWFGDWENDPENASKAVDSQTGEPLVVYHGTRTKGRAIDAFDINRAGSQTDSGWMGQGFYFGSRETADAYAGHYEFDPGHFPEGGAVYPAFLLMRSPATLVDSERNDGPRTMVRELLDLPDSATSVDVRDELESTGHDSVAYQRFSPYGNGYKEYVVLSPSQIKSATGNVGTFGGSNADIRFSRPEASDKRSREDDAAYMAAVERGDMETAQRMVNDAAVRAGYVPDSGHRMSHAAPNSKDDVSLADVRTSGLVPDDYWTHPQWYQSDSRERVAFDRIADLFQRMDRMKIDGKDPENATIAVYRAVPKSVKEGKIRNGDWVSPSESYARDEGMSILGGYRIISQRVKAKNLWWDGNSAAELGYDDGGNYAYKNTKNNRKLLDAVTRDDDGNVIPLSRRFRTREFDPRFSRPDIAGYQSDMFGNPVPSPGRRSSRAAQPATEIRDTQTPEGEYFVRTIVGHETRRKLGVDLIRTPEDAAQATAYLYKSAVERLDGIVTDKDGRPLAVVGGFKGAVAQASVYQSTLVAEAVRVPGAAHIWFSHNHPSGKSDLSNADRSLAATLSDVFDGSGIEPMGLLAVGKGKFSFTSKGPRDEHSAATIPTPGAGITVPVIDREQRANDASITITNPNRAVAVARGFHLQGGDGIMLMNVQNEVAAWVPITRQMRGTLRHTGGLNAIYRAISESNAAAAILVHDGSLDAAHPDSASVTVGNNIAAALAKIDVRPLDSINVKTGESLAQQGFPVSAGPLYSQRSTRQQIPPQLLTNVDAVQSAVRHALDAWKGDKPIVRVVQSVAEARAHGAQLSEDAPADAEGWWDGRSTVWIIAGNNRDVARSLEVLSHEVIGHYGIERIMGGKSWSRLVADVRRLRGLRRSDVSSGTLKALQSAERRYGSEDDATFAREFLAIMAEQGVRSGLTMRVVAAIRRFLAKLGIPVNISKAFREAELLDALYRGRKRVTQAARGQAASTGRPAREMAFSQSTPTFYSAMLESVAVAKGLPKAGGTAQQWKGWMDGAVRRGEFKQSERDWLGVDAWLDAQDKAITREQLADFIRANEVQVEDVVLGGPPARDIYGDANPERLPEGWRVERSGEGFAVIDEAGDEVSWADTENDAIEIARDMDERAAREAASAPRYANYQIPGGENYRELLLTLPQSARAKTFALRNPETGGFVGAFATKVEAEEWQRSGPRKEEVAAWDVIEKEGELIRPDYRSSHWGEKNVLAHIRSNERTDADGVKTLFLEEIQSDWHQAGRKQGYATGKERSIADIDAELSKVQRERSALIDAAAALPDSQMAEFNRMNRQIKHMAERMSELNREWDAAMKAGKTVPNAPFKATDEWVTLAFKRMVRHAAENGFDRIAWTTGSQQEERYWSNDLVRPAVERWSEISKPYGAREQVLEHFGSELAAVVPLEVVDVPVLAALKNDQVRRAVVESIPVDVMNILADNGVTPDQLLREPNVIGARLPVDARPAVSAGLARATELVGARLRAALDRVLAAESAGRDEEVLPAVRASDLDARVVMGLLSSRGRVSGDGRLPDAGSRSASPGAEAPGAVAAQGKLAGVGGERSTAELARALNRHAEIVAQRTGKAFASLAVEPPPGSGMRSFYDNILPKAVNKWAKPFGAKVGETVISVGDKSIAKRTVHSIDVTPAMREAALAGLPLFSRQDAGETWLGRASDRVAGAMERTAKAVDARVQGDRSIPSHWTPEQQDAAKKFETFMPRSPIADRVRAIRNATGERIVQKVFDQYRSLRSLSETAWMQAHLSRGTETTLEAIVTRGIPELRDGAIAISEGSKSFLDTLRELGGPEEQNRFFMYVVGQRARALADEHSVFVGGQQVRTLRNQEDAIQFATQIATEQALSESPKRVTVKHTSRERLFTENDINALLSMADGKSPDGRARKSTYAKAQREMTAYQSALLDIAEKAGLVNPESRKDWETDFYIPFYRVMTNDDGSVSTRFATGETGLIRQEVIKRLKGGKENLGDPLTNLLSNWSHLLSASMKNMAANNALAQAEGSGIANRVEAGDVWTMIDGKRAYWEVADPGIVESLAALDFNGYNNAFMRAAGKTKRLLTMGVTIAPGFRIRNLVRDVVHAIAVTDAGYNPLAIAIQGWKSSGKDSEMLSQMLAGGGAMRFGAFTDGDSGDVVRGMLRRHISPDQIITTAEGLQAAIGKSFEAYMDLGDRMENVSRAVVYDRAMKRTGSHLIASFEARDVMNFTSMGSSAATRAMAQVLPFFNARLQGLHKLGRGAKENPKRFLSTIGVIGMASALLYLLNADDDEYRALPDYVRDTYWPIKVGGRWLYVPKPFEVGAMATVIERFTEMAFAGNDYQARDFRDTVVSILVNNLSMNPVPQIILPSAEAWYNYDMFRDRPIDSMSMQRLLPEDRYDASTSAGAVVVGRALGVSPQKLEHLVSGYFGWIGIQALNVSDYIARSLVDFSESPKRDFNNVQNWFVVGDFVKEDTPSKYVERFYAMQRDIDQIYATANYARASGDYERYRELMSDPSLQYRPLTRSAANRIALLNRQSRAVISDRNMTAEEKTQKLRAIRVATNAVARSVDEQVRRSTAQQTR